ncbi:MAG: hypothetical protein J0665_14805 [Deltaproteobacteria bacterium]|nr:hypothetical protein [Deltaproteobacteria bacterium]
MAFDLSQIERIHNFILSTQRLGQIQCGSLKMDMLTPIGKMLKAPDINSLAFARQVLGMVAIRSSDTDEEKDGEKEAAKLSDDDILQVANDEVDLFAIEFVNHNKWLLPNDNDKRKVVTNDNGERIVRFVPLIDDFKKRDDEAGSDFFVRVLRHYFDDQQLRLKKMLEPLSAQLASVQLSDSIKKMLEPVSSLLATNIYKDSTLESLRMNFSLSDQLKDSIKAYDRSSVNGILGQATYEPVIPQMPEIRIPENPLIETNKRLNKVLELMEGMRPLASQSAELIGNMNDTALRMQSDSISNARKTEWYTRIAIGIAVISIIVSSIFSWLSYKNSKQDAAKNDRQIEAFQKEIRNLIAAQEKDRNILVKVLNDSLQSQKRLKSR